MEARFIELAGPVNLQTPHFVISKIQSPLMIRRKPIRGAHVFTWWV